MPKAIILKEFLEWGDLSALSLEEIEAPKPDGYELLIDVEAFALNYGDLNMFTGEYTFVLDLPARVGDECAGIVREIGPKVVGFKPGDRVATMPIMFGKNGVNGEVALYDSRFCAKVPANISSMEACTVWVSYFTAYAALIEVAKIRPGDTVLITAGSSAAGVAAMQICRDIGATTVGTTRSSAKAGYLRELGYDFVVVQNSGTLSDVVLEASKGTGARIVYDPIGGTIVREYKDALGKDAVIFLYGLMDNSDTVVPMLEMVRANACLRPFSVYHYIVDDALRERGVLYVSRALSEGRLKPQVGPVYALADWRQALVDQMKKTDRRGKMVVRVK
jgi:NADPH2:quinone reductase